MGKKLDRNQRIKMGILFLVIGLAYYVNFKSKKEFFFSPEYLYERMIRSQKAIHHQSPKDISSYQQHIKILEKRFPIILKELLANKDSQELWSDNQRQLIEALPETGFNWSIDAFHYFRENWKGTETLRGRYKNFEIKSFPEYRNDGEFFVYFNALINRNGRDFYGLSSYSKNESKYIISEVVDRTENLLWLRIGYPLNDKSLFWLTDLGDEASIDQKGYRISLEYFEDNKIQLRGFEILFDEKSEKLLIADPFSGEYQLSK